MIYVISDLHGYEFEKFQALLSRAGFSEEDYLFILGDVIDRGKDSIKYLSWLLVQDNVQLILGNHEAMMLSCGFLFEEVTEDSVQSLTAKDLELLSAWKENGAKWTLEGLYTLSAEERRDILEYLKCAPVYEAVSAGGRDFLLTHSGIRGFENGKKLSAYSAEDFLWNRPGLSDRYFENVTTIFGHTPTFIYGEQYRGKLIKTHTWINIDAGAGYGYAPILLRLDDMKEFV
ncbi:MAG: serine/threonine protein phosphatase [Ruminococcus sp.]|nr:serine/threonine protein phosphatase [Ruminococcus sp.]